MYSPKLFLTVAKEGSMGWGGIKEKEDFVNRAPEARAGGGSTHAS